MKKSEAPISGHFDPAARLTALLRKILDDIGRSVDVLKEAVEGRQLPYVQGNDGDIELAAMYLRDLGLPNDGERLHREYLRLYNKCIDEWLVAMADGESQEFHRDQLIELFGQFPRSEDPSDPTVADRKAAILGIAVQFSDYLSGLISSVNASEKREPRGIPKDGLRGEPSTPTGAETNNGTTQANADRRSLEEIESNTPELDTQSIEWIAARKKNQEKLGYPTSTLATYRLRNMGGRQLSPYFGIDKDGRRWRRQPDKTEKSMVYYYAIDVNKYQPKASN
jgi:hypothetical protein